MKLTSTLAVTTLLAGLVTAPSSHAQSGGSLVYVPPDRSAPPARVSGGTRSTGGSDVAVRVLAPEHAGLTISEQPTLYWYVSKAVNKPVIVTVVDEDAIDPVAELQLKPPFSAGVHALSLAAHKVRLEPNKTYQWGVALVSESGDRFKDVYAGGAITRIEPTSSLKAKLDKSAVANRASLLAEAGIWYDAIDALSTGIDGSAQGGQLRGQRRALLEQVGLSKVAQFDAK